MPGDGGATPIIQINCWLVYGDAEEHVDLFTSKIEMTFPVISVISILLISKPDDMIFISSVAGFGNIDI